MAKHEVEKTDPAPSPVSIIEEKVRRIVRDVTTSGVDQLRQLREDIDETMRNIQAEDTRIVNDIGRHAQSVQSSINTVQIMREAFEKLKAQIQVKVIQESGSATTAPSIKILP